MCGRTACTLAPDDICKACTYRDKGGKSRRPMWRDAPGGKQYYPSYNISPASHTPVLLSSQHYAGELDDVTERVVQPMKWGLVPAWHKGDPYKLEYETNNCRAEGMLEKRTYKVPLQKGQRCVVLAEGFFEWKRDKTSKQPYFVYFPQPYYTQTDDKSKVKQEIKTEPHTHPVPTVQVKTEVKGETDDDEDADVKAEVKEEQKDEVDGDFGASAVKEEPSWENEEEENDYHGPRLLTMAGVFDIWQPSSGEAPMYSYSVITVEAPPAFSHIHNRMPAILQNEEEVDQWLNFGEVPIEKAAKLIRSTETFQMHPVSTVVNNSRNKTPDCIKPISLDSKPKPNKSSQLMMNWLQQGKKTEEEPASKKPKTD